MRLPRYLVAAGCALAISSLQAAEPAHAIRQSLQSLQPDLPIVSIEESPLAGLYQVQLESGSVLYSSADGRFVVQGYLLQIADGKATNLTEQLENRGVARLINAQPAAEMVIFPAASSAPAKTHITVFTDTDCSFCQKLHAEVPELNRRGIEVRYVAFPRQGVGSATYQTMVNVWCAKDPRAAMTQAKSRGSVEAAQCDNPVARQFELGQMIGVRGTPAIVLADGQLIPGYQPAAALAPAALAAAGK